MPSSNKAIFTKTILQDLFGSIIYFPVWWYTRGLKKVGGFLFSFVTAMEMRLAWRIWVVNLFKPMYAVADIPGRIISFFMRLFMIIVRGIALFFIALFAFILFIVYLLWLPFVIVMILAQFGLFLF